MTKSVLGFTSIALVLVSSLVACASSKPDSEAKGTSQAADSADDDDDDSAGDDDDNAPAGDDDDSTPTPAPTATHGMFSNWCQASVQIDDTTNQPYCSLDTTCGGWSTQSVVTTSVDDSENPCACECQ